MLRNAMFRTRVLTFLLSLQREWAMNAPKKPSRRAKLAQGMAQYWPD